MKSKTKILFIVLCIFNIQIIFGVPQSIESHYKQICWDCYNPEIPIQNFLTRYRETLRNLCFKGDAKACSMMATLYSSLHNDFDAQDYWQRSCKLGNKEDCAMISKDDK